MLATVLATASPVASAFKTGIGLLSSLFRRSDQVASAEARPAEATPAIPATGPRINASQQRQVNAVGEQGSCHTCGATSPGTRSGNWVGDHQPPTALTPPGQPQTLYPQCLTCSRIQGGQVRQLLRRAAEALTNTPDP